MVTILMMDELKMVEIKDGWKMVGRIKGSKKISRNSRFKKSYNVKYFKVGLSHSKKI